MVQQLATYAIIFVVVAMVLGFGSLVLQEVQTQIADDYGDNTTAYNATGSGLEGLGTFADWLPLLAIVLIAGIIILVLVANFGGFMRGGI